MGVVGVVGCGGGGVGCVLCLHTCLYLIIPMYVAGRNILAFCRHHGAVKDILYALLRGRTLVILGKQQK